VEYAKADPEDILIRIHATNRGPEPAGLDLLPTIWFRNTWSWYPNPSKPSLALDQTAGTAVSLLEPSYGRRYLHCNGAPEFLFTENDTNTKAVFGYDAGAGYSKDAFNRYLIHSEADAINPMRIGTKAAARYALTIQPHETVTLQLRLNATAPAEA